MDNQTETGMKRRAASMDNQTETWPEQRTASMDNQMETWLKQRAASQGKALEATLELTPLCNMKCSMCYIRHSSREAESEGGLKDLSFWIRQIDQMKEAGVLFVSLIGGEILTYRWTRQIYTYLLENGFYVNFTTNGTLFAEGIPSWLMNNRPRYVSVSVYGGSDATYEKLAGIKNGCTRTLKGIENLLNAGITIKLNYCVTPENMQDLGSFFDLANAYNVPAVASAYTYPPVRTNAHRPFLRLDAGTAAAAELQIRQMRDPDKFNDTLNYLNLRRFRTNTERHTNRFYCKAGSYSFWITWKGFMTPCGLLEEPKISLRIYHCRSLGAPVESCQGD